MVYKQIFINIVEGGVVHKRIFIKFPCHITYIGRGRHRVVGWTIVGHFTYIGEAGWSISNCLLKLCGGKVIYKRIIINLVGEGVVVY